MITTRSGFFPALFRNAALALAAVAAARSASAAVRVTADVSVHAQFRGEPGRVATFRVTNNSTMGETVGSVMVVAPGSAWALRTCSSAPPGWTRTPGVGACVFRSAAGRMDDVQPGATATFQVSLDVPAGSTNASGVWGVRFALDENVSADSPLATPGEGGLGASVWVREVLDAVGSITQVPLGGACPAPMRQAVAGAVRNIVICGRNRGDVALTPQAAASSLAGSFIGAAGTFTSRQA